MSENLNDFLKNIDGKLSSTVAVEFNASGKIAAQKHHIGGKSTDPNGKFKVKAVAPLEPTGPNEDPFYLVTLENKDGVEEKTPWWAAHFDTI